MQADLRGPLPPLEDLDKLRVGVKGGHTLHLCRGEEAVGYASIERSLDFSEHYGASLYSHGSMATMAHSKYSLDFSEHYGFTHRKE